MNVDLSSELEDLVSRKLETGAFASASDLFREALRLLDERDRLYEREKEDVRKKIEAGMASLRAGRATDGESIFARIDAEFDASVINRSM